MSSSRHSLPGSGAPDAVPLSDASATALAHLRGLLDVAQTVRRAPALDEVLAAVARAVSETLGFKTVVINVYRPETDDYKVSTVYGSEPASEVLLGKVSSSESWAPLLDPGFRRHGVYYIRAGAFDWSDGIESYVPDTAEPAEACDDAWHPDDAMFIALEGAGGRRYGIMSVDEPTSRRRPDDQQLDVLTAVAAHATLAIESTFQVAALESAV